MAVPSTSEARLVSVEVAYADLLPNDAVGPQDVALPEAYIVEGIPKRSTEERFVRRMTVELRATAGETVAPVTPLVSDTLFVRRYAATVTVTRSDGLVDKRKPKLLLRSIGDAVTFVDPGQLKLSAGDRVALAP